MRSSGEGALVRFHGVFDRVLRLHVHLSLRTCLGLVLCSFRILIHMLSFALCAGACAVVYNDAACRFPPAVTTWCNMPRTFSGKPRPAARGADIVENERCSAVGHCSGATSFLFTAGTTLSDVITSPRSTYSTMAWMQPLVVRETSMANDASTSCSQHQSCVRAEPINQRVDDRPREVTAIVLPT